MWRSQYPRLSYELVHFDVTFVVLLFALAHDRRRPLRFSPVKLTRCRYVFVGSTPMSHSSPGLLRFGSFEFDPRTRELRRHGMRVKLTPHEMSLLCLLLEPPLRVRTREEIQRHMWPANTFVDFEHGMNKIVHSLREALGDSATNPRFIETVNATGYRFIPQFLKPEFVDKRELFSNAASIAVLPITTAGPQDLVHHCERITFHVVAGLD